MAQLGCDGGSSGSPTAPRALACASRAVFGDPHESPYTLPFPVGETYFLSQAYCSRGSHSNQLAYDFDMPPGATIVAARAGVVTRVKEDSPDGSGYGTHNAVDVRHGDGTVAFYAHFQHRGVDVEVGDVVRRGQRLGGCGDTGSPGHFHLHFGVYRDPPREGDDVAVNFRNTDGPLDERGGLVAGAVYTALPD